MYFIHDIVYMHLNQFYLTGLVDGSKYQTLFEVGDLRLVKFIFVFGSEVFGNSF